MSVDSEDEYFKIHQACERLEQVSNRLPEISDLLIKQMDEFCKENVALLLLTQKGLQAIHQTDAGGGIEDTAQEIYISLKKKREALQSQQNFNAPDFMKLLQISSSILAETNLVVNKLQESFHLLNSKNFLSQQVSLQQFHEQDEALLDQLRNLANSIQSTSIILKETINQDRVKHAGHSGKLRKWKKLADSAIQNRDFEKAINFLELARQVQPKNSDILGELGLLYLQVGQMEQAEECLSAIIQVSSPNLKALYLKARICEKQGKKQEAFDLLSMALDNSTDLLLNKKILLEMAFLSYQLEKFAKAESLWEQVLKLNPFEDEARRWLSLITPV